MLPVLKTAADGREVCIGHMVDFLAGKFALTNEDRAHLPAFGQTDDLLRPRPLGKKLPQQGWAGGVDATCPFPDHRGGLRGAEVAFRADRSKFLSSSLPSRGLLGTMRRTAGPPDQHRQSWKAD